MKRNLTQVKNCVRFSLLLAQILFWSLPCRAQDFRIGDYRALAVIGSPSLEEGVDYVSFTGDFGFSGSLPDQDVVEQQLTYESNLLSRFNLRVINLELMLPGNSVEQDGRIEHAVLQIIKRTGFNVVARANNHAVDYGPAGFAYNTTRLRDEGLPTIGTREKPLYLWSTGGHDVALYALTDSTDHKDHQHSILNTTDEDLQFIQRQSAEAHFRIAFIHLGSLSVFPSPHERTQVNRLIDAGADLVVCTGSHFIKGFTTEQGRPVIYGIGNYLFFPDGGDTEPVGMHVVAGFRSGTLTQLFVVPFHNSPNRGDIAPLDESSFGVFKRTFQDRSTQDVNKYFSDPNLIEKLKEKIANLTFSSVGDFRIRYLTYGTKILFHNYPIATISVTMLLAIAACMIVRPAVLLIRRKTNRGGTSGPRIRRSKN